MKNVFKLSGVIVLAAIVGFSMAACDNNVNDVEDGGSNPVMRTVTFDANGGTVEGEATKAVQVEDGKKVELPEDPVNSPKKFWGWFDNKTQPYGNIFTGTIPITANKTVYARWDDNEPPTQFNVTFIANGGKFAGDETTQIIKVYLNDTVIPPYASRNDGYMLAGWNSKADGTGTAFDKDEPITAALTVYAQWKKPEEMPDKDRWGKWVADDATATLDYSVDDDGVCKITVGGTPQPNDETDGWGRWKANAYYIHTANTGKSYIYTFEAWTESGTRELSFQYNTDNDNSIYFGESISLTTARKTYTVYGQPLSKGASNDVSFQCADQLGTFYVKMLEIKEYIQGKLTITNFSGNPGLVQGSDVNGTIRIDTNTEIFIRGSLTPDGWHNYTIEGDTINIPVWLLDHDKMTITPYNGNITVQAGSLFFEQLSRSPSAWSADYFTNKVPITFTNGNATINFATQMQDIDSYISSEQAVIDEMESWLSVQPDNTPATAYTYKLNIADNYSFSQGRNILKVRDILNNNKTKYVKLDLSGSTMTKIPNGAFSTYDPSSYSRTGCANLIGITIPDSVTSIEYDAFSGCVGLTSVTIGNNVTSIGSNAFERCTSLTSINIPNSVTSIGSSAFSGCTGLTSVIIPDNVTSIGSNAFDGTAWLTAWLNNQSDGVVYLGKVAFTYKGDMPENTSIILLDGTKVIAGAAFKYCTSLTSVIIPNSVTSIGWSAFSFCTGLTSVTIGNSVTSIGDAAFAGCTSLTSVTIGDSVISIEYLAFSECTSLASITIPDSVISIEYAAFSYCTGLTSVTIGSGVTSIGDYAFSYCTSLTSVTFQSTITEDNFGDYAFHGDLRDKYLAGGIGTYTTTTPVPEESWNWDPVWTKQP
jgi:hypothetical protein